MTGCGSFLFVEKDRLPPLTHPKSAGPSRSVSNRGLRFVMAEGAFRLGEGAGCSFYLTEDGAWGRVIARMPASLW
jgi:hypothetical protein